MRSFSLASLESRRVSKVSSMLTTPESGSITDTTAPTFALELERAKVAP
jgi:hypothetical protein